MLKRNDAKAALKVFIAAYKSTRGKPDPDLCQSLIMMQDDPTEYTKLVQEFLSDVGG